MKERVADALRAEKETREFEFKQSFDPASLRDWCELLKDIFALANSGGGGVIVFGINNIGMPAGTDVSSIAALDPARITDKIEAYTGVHFDEFQLLGQKKDGQSVVCLDVQEASVPLVPRRPGTYPSADGRKQDRAFSVGVVYVRHGAKSEPANSADLRRMIDRRAATARRDVLRNVRRVVAAPSGSTLEVVLPAKRARLARRPESAPSSMLDGREPVAVRPTMSSEATPVRITSDPAAPTYHLVDPDQTHPYRMVDLLKEVNSQLTPLGRSLCPYDIHAIHDVHGVFSRIEFSYKPQYGSRKYTKEFAAWLVDQMRRNQMFHLLARAKRRRLRRNARRSPAIETAPSDGRGSSPRG